MSLKQHNDIVEKLLKTIETKDKELQSFKKQLNKASLATQPNPRPAETQKQFNRKLTMLQKEQKQKVTALTSQLRSKSIENKELKQRLNRQKNLQVKQKEHISEVLKKVGLVAASEPRVAQLVGHYERQLQRKDKVISGLQKQIKQNYYQGANKDHSSKQEGQCREQQGSEGQQVQIESQTMQKMPRILDNQHYHTKYQQQIAALRGQNNKIQKILEERTKQFKDLTKRYSELTKQYYKLLNEYGVKQEPTKEVEQYSQKSTKFTKFTKKKPKTTNILEDMLQKFDTQSQLSHNQNSLSYSFLSALPALPQQGATIPQSQHQSQLQTLQLLIQQILELLGIENRVQIIPNLTKIKSKLSQTAVYENIGRFMQSMLYRMGMGKIGMSDMLGQLEKFEEKVEKNAQGVEILDEVCIEVGAKRDKVIQKIKDLKATQEMFFSNMKNVAFMQQLPKANKVVEFVEYFQLDKQVCQLPQQLKKMYEQLKFVDRFLKQASNLLEREPQGLEKTLQIVLRYIQRRKAEESLKIPQRGDTFQNSRNKK